MRTIAHALRAFGMVSCAAMLVLSGCDRGEEGAALPNEAVPVSISGAAEAPAEAADGAAKPGAPADKPADAPQPAAKLQADAIFTGSSAPHRRSTISANQSGTVRGVFANEGETVTAGQVIVQLDTTDFDLRLRQAQAAVRSAQVQVQTARIEADRAKKLLASNAIPERQNDMAVAQTRAAGAALQQAIVVRDMAKRSISEAEVRAPFDAVVVRRHISEGEAAASMPPTPYLTLEQRSPLDVRLDIPSVRLRDVAVGTALRVRFPALDREVEGTVTRLVPSVDPRSRAAVAIVELPNADGSIAPGLFAEARLAAPARPVEAAKPTADALPAEVAP
ncbi:MAG: efflux RND transporter periplasmic adaptor subunit [Myxococcota bacterium]